MNLPTLTKREFIALEIIKSTERRSEETDFQPGLTPEEVVDRAVEIADLLIEKLEES